MIFQAGTKTFTADIKQKMYIINYHLHLKLDAPMIIYNFCNMVNSCQEHFVQKESFNSTFSVTYF